MTRAQTPSLMAGVGSRAGVGDDAVTDAGNISGGVDGDGDDDDDDANAAADMTVARATVNELQEQRMLRAMLIKHLDPEQTMRYEKWRSSKLPESAVKRVKLCLFLFFPCFHKRYSLLSAHICTS